MWRGKLNLILERTWTFLVTDKNHWTSPHRLDTRSSFSCVKLAGITGSPTFQTFWSGVDFWNVKRVEMHQFALFLYLLCQQSLIGWVDPYWNHSSLRCCSITLQNNMSTDFFRKLVKASCYVNCKYVIQVGLDVTLKDVIMWTLIYKMWMRVGYNTSDTNKFL